MRRTLSLGAVVVVVAVGLIWWWHRRPADKAQPSAASAATSHAPGAKKQREPAKPATLSGKVTRKSDGAGIAGATVSLAWAELGADFGSSKMPTLVATTDAGGAWTVKDVAPGDWVIAATAKGFLPAEHAKVTIASAEQRGGIDLVLDAGGTPLRGTVSDVGGGGISGARITARRQAFRMTREAEFVTLTGADGTYELTLPDGEYRVSASHDDYESDGERAEIAGKPVTLDFTLIPGAVIRGQVLARDTGKPVAGAFVSVDTDRRGVGRRGGDHSVMADGNGEFVVRGLSSGAISIEAHGRGYASAQPTAVQLGIGEEVDGVQVFVDGAFSISGRVVKKGTKTGIAGARVGAFSMSQGGQAESPEPTDSDGAFEIPGVKPGSFMLYAAAEGSMLEIGKPVEVKDRDVTDVTIELASGVTLSGRVEPAAVASLSLELQGEVGLGNMFDMVKAAMVHADSDASGAFKLENVPAGKFHIAAMTKEGRAGKLAVTVAEADQSGLIVTLEPRASIAGRVVDTNGKPVPGMTVFAKPEEDKPFTISMNDMRNGDTRSAADGSFKLVGLDAGTYQVKARQADDWAEMIPGKQQKKGTVVTLAKGEDKTGITITVEVPNGVIKGVVMGTDGKPAADSWVVARKEPDKELADKLGDKMPARFMSFFESEPVLTGGDGRFSIGKLKQGTYTLVADGPRGSSHGEKGGVKVGDTATVQLASLGTLTVTVTSRGQPVKQYDVSCDAPGNDIERRAVTTDGSYKLEHLAPGEYKCHVRADNGTGDGTATVPAGEAKLAINLAAWGSLTGVVVSVLTGKPIPDLAVVANSEDNPSGFLDAMTGRGVKTDANGRFVVDKVAAGKGRIMFVPAKLAITNMESHEYEAKEGQRVDLGTIKIVPPRSGDAATFGLTTEVKGDVLEVTNVKDGGPAQAVGVQVGDKITALEGQPLKQLGAELGQKLLASGAPSVGQTVKVTLERGPTVTLTAVKW